jgi:SAM-dependent methyltransferase
MREVSAMAASLVYRSPWLYEVLMMALYGRYYSARYGAIADLVPAGASVLDLCCGPGVLFDRYLRHKGVDYTGLDVNAGFVARINRRGGRGQVWDLRGDDPLPGADVVIMQASLYHFLPDPVSVVGRMLRAARARVIIAEPIRNLADSGWPLLAAIARRGTDPGHGEQALRFNERTLDAFLGGLATPPSRSFLIPGGREKIYVFEVGGSEDGLQRA